MRTEKLLTILEILKKEYPSWNAPIVTYIKNARGTPFKILISTLISQRTKDETTAGAVKRLFSGANTPGEMARMDEDLVRKLIYPAGFYKVKAARILEISRILEKNYNSTVPDEIDELLKLPGVGRKTANLVITLGYDKPGICVDTHVHRISNRWGYVKTRTPAQTEFSLREKLPLQWWIPYNDILVAFGQTCCKPVSPLCSICPVDSLCPKIGVEKHR
ncbi:MAG: endonuclease III [Brevinematales bacterium]